MKRVVNIVLSVLIGDKFFDMRGRAGYAGVCSVTFGGDGVCSEKSGDYNLFFFSGVFVSLDSVGLNGAQAA